MAEQKEQAIRYVFVSNPYTALSEDESEQQRFEIIREVIAILFDSKPNIIPICPVAYTHQFTTGVTNVMPKRDWYKVCIDLIQICTELFVVTMPGWEKSKGVMMEIEEAKKLGIPITYVDIEDVIRIKGLDTL